MQRGIADNGLKGGRIGRIVVRPRPGQPSQGQLQAGSLRFSCSLGRGGISANKREGDGATPLGPMRLISVYLRDRRFRTVSRLAWQPITATLGWCEVPADRNYNRPVRIPYGASHERMRRDDHLYDACIVLDWNISPRKRGRGSAIFFHLARQGFTPTQGCVGVTHRVMARLLPLIGPDTVLEVRRG